MVSNLQEAENKSREFNTVSDELAQKQTALNNMSSELSALRDSTNHQRKRVHEMLRSLLTDLGEVGGVITKNNSSDLKKPEGEIFLVLIESKWHVNVGGLNTRGSVEIADDCLNRMLIQVELLFGPKLIVHVANVFG